MYQNHLFFSRYYRLYQYFEISLKKRLIRVAIHSKMTLVHHKGTFYGVQQRGAIGEDASGAVVEDLEDNHECQTS